MIGLTLPIEGSFHRTVSDPVLATTAIAAVALGGILGCSPAFKAYVVGCSRAVLVVLTSLLGAGALVVTWLEIPDGERDQIAAPMRAMRLARAAQDEREPGKDPDHGQHHARADRLANTDG